MMRDSGRRRQGRRRRRIPQTPAPLFLQLPPLGVVFVLAATLCSAFLAGTTRPACCRRLFRSTTILVSVSPSPSRARAASRQRRRPWTAFHYAAATVNAAESPPATYCSYNFDRHKRSDDEETAQLLRAMDECWASTSWTIHDDIGDENDDRIAAVDQIWRHLVSPAPQSYYVLNRAIGQQQAMLGQQDDDYGDLAEERRTNLLKCCAHLLKDGRSLVVKRQYEEEDNSNKNKSRPRMCRPGKDWNVVMLHSSRKRKQDDDHLTTDHDEESNNNEESCWAVLFTAPPTKSEYTSVATLANEILEATTKQQQQQLLSQLQERLSITLGTDIRGRAAADAAFALALAGVTDPTVYRSLYHVIRLELERVQQRLSSSSSNSNKQRSKRLQHVWHMVEKVAASGALAVADDDDVTRIYQLVAKALKTHQLSTDTAKPDSKGDSDGGSTAATLLRSPKELDLLHPRPLLWLWRYSSRLSKPQLISMTDEMTSDDATSQKKKDDHIVSTLANQPSWTPTFDDNYRPLVVDVGCGLGVSLLGLATLGCRGLVTSGGGDASAQRVLGGDGATPSWSDCNFLGGDANPLTTRFSSGIAERWQASRLGGTNKNNSNADKQMHNRRLEYCTMSTEELLDAVATNYPGPVALVLLQFPTPYRLKGEHDDADESVSSSNNFNSQLPDDPTSPAFMASLSVLRRIARLLNNNNNKGGRLLVQSNCEDVAMHIRNVALLEGFHCVQSPCPVTEPPPITERTHRWLDANPAAAAQRAVGYDWWSEPILIGAATETEAACALQGTPVHRCLLQVNKDE